MPKPSRRDASTWGEASSIRLRPHHPVVLHPLGHGQPEIEDGEAPLGHGGEEQHQQQARQSQHAVGQAAQQAVDPATAPGGEPAQQGSQQGCGEDAQHPQQQGEPSRRREPRHQAAAHLIAPEGLLPGGVGQELHQILGGGVRPEHWAQQGKQHHQQEQACSRLDRERHDQDSL
ncbi:hypothetical protein ACSZMQ_14625 [Aeromonas rivipollensis]